VNKPHIIYFVADQLRSDALHHLGNPASQTPNMDSLAEEGVSFQHAYCQNPVCVPSRTSFLTGLYPHTTGHRTMHFLQNEDEPNILKEMKNNG
jgi:arylsulfatase A-like enzyme